LVLSFVDVVDFFLYHVTGKAHEAFERLCFILFIFLKFDLFLLCTGIARLNRIKACQMLGHVIYLQKVLASTKAL